MCVVFDRLPEEKKKLVSQIRAAIMELDKDILEQVRLHRIVYSKGFAMRDFAELVLERGKVVLRTLSRNYTKTIEIRSAEDIEKALQEAKFYSVEKFVLGFTGTIEDITFNYSVIRLDEGAVVKIPNNIMIQAAVVSHPHTETIVRVRYEAKMTKDLEFLLNKVKEAVQNNQWVANREKIEVNVEAITQNTVLLLIDAPCKGENETKARSSLLLSVQR